MWKNIKTIWLNHYKKLILTFWVVWLENILFLTYPVFWGFAINAVLNWETLKSLIYAFVVLFMWLIWALRRYVDTRVFTAIYTQIAVSVILNQRKNNLSHSEISARVILSRKFVDFFEEHLPTSLTAIFSVFGAVFMLLILEFWIWVFTVFILVIFLIFLPKYASMNEQLYFDLNNNIEKDVKKIQFADEKKLLEHYWLLAKLRVKISNREAFSYFVIGFAMSLLFGFSFIYLSQVTGVKAWYIYSITTYLWMFATSLDDMPRLIETYSNLRDIAKRVEIEKIAE